MNRYCIRNQTHFANFPFTDAGLMQIRAFRRSHPQFKRRHIKQVLQLKPYEVPCGEIMEVTYK
jgi:hypothetical protein